MAVQVSAEMPIRRARRTVADFMLDPRNDLAWIGGIKRVDAPPDGMLHVGTRVTRSAEFLGRRFTYVNEITSIVDGAELAMRSVAGPFPMEVRYTVEEDGDGCIARVDVSGSTDGFYQLAAPLLNRAVKRSIQGDLRRLKRILEQDS